jgi:hypothetical protein
LAGGKLLTGDFLFVLIRVISWAGLGCEEKDPRKSHESTPTKSQGRHAKRGQDDDGVNT